MYFIEFLKNGAPFLRQTNASTNDEMAIEGARLEGKKRGADQARIQDAQGKLVGIFSID